MADKAGKKKLLKFSDKELLKVVEHLSQRKSNKECKEKRRKTGSIGKLRGKEKTKFYKHKRRKRVQVVDLRSSSEGGVAPSTDSVHQFLDNQMSKQKRVPITALKKNLRH